MTLKGSCELICTDEKEGTGKNEGTTYYHVTVKTGKEIWELFTNEAVYTKVSALPALTKLDTEIDVSKFGDKTYLRLKDASKAA